MASTSADLVKRASLISVLAEPSRCWLGPRNNRRIISRSQTMGLLPTDGTSIVDIGNYFSGFISQVIEYAAVGIKASCRLGDLATFFHTD